MVFIPPVAQTFGHAPIPNPGSFEGLFIGLSSLADRFLPSFGPKPKRSMATALSDTSDETVSGPEPARSMSGSLGLGNAKMEIHDLSRLEHDPDPDLPRYLVAHFNPKEVEKTIKVHWNKLAIPGLSHQRLQYHHTESVPFKFLLHFDALKIANAALRGFEGPHGIGPAGRFLESLCYPRADAQTVVEGAPPRVLFYWPNFLSINCVVEQEDWKYTQFSSDGSPVRMTCMMTLSEIRDVRLSSSDVLRFGDKRKGADRPPTDGANIIKVAD